MNALFNGNLWVSGQQGGTLRVAARTDLSNFTNVPCADAPSGVFSVDSDSAYTEEGWPSAVGAPVDAEGKPRAYGDQMAWTTYCQSANGSILNQPFTDLRINAAVFGHDQYSNVVFIRFELRNESASAISDAYVGFWTDPDLETDVARNLVGVDLEERLAYIYAAPDVSDRALTAGSVILETPADAPLAAHRIVTKNSLRETYGENGLGSAAAYDMALRGLDNAGNPMVDPTTNQASPFAFTGNPVLGTGWLDGYLFCAENCEGQAQQGREARQLISAGSFTIGAGETEVFTLAYVVQTGSSFEDSLAQLRALSSTLRGAPDLWRFVSQS
ncbi:hypothetical protein [Rubricoccus marinus]|uniref:Uncharacterized protein n=1 Tax=Rubricoccus marinus TaxID=716817 RepID=A0A259TZ74_9BACT|nr:hypothetical protein [Rubricoccus marinus]OZC03021.1 hypothetical protein BSZ36_08585 [Rubricoccus marinus]